MGVTRRQNQAAHQELQARRATRALESCRSGLSYEKVSQQVVDEDGNRIWRHRQAVHNDVKWALEQARTEMFGEVDLYRAQALDRLEALLAAIWPSAMTGDEKRVGEARRIINDISDLTGAKAPIRMEIGEGDIDRLFRDVEKQISDRTRSIEGSAQSVTGGSA